MADFTFNGVPFVSEPMSFPRDRVFFIADLAIREWNGEAPRGSFARWLARRDHYLKRIRPKYKRGHRKFKEANRG